MVAKMQPAREQSELRQVVLDQIRQNPETSEMDVSVAAEQGIVTLRGSVKTDAERIAVETVAKQVGGVRAIADDLDVKPSLLRANGEIARDALKELRSHIFLAGEDIKVIVRDGLVTLEGDVHQELQKMLAEAQVRRIRGIHGVSNQLGVKPEAPARVEIEGTGRAGTGTSNEEAWVETGEAEAG